MSKRSPDTGAASFAGRRSYASSTRCRAPSIAWPGLRAIVDRPPGNLRRIRPSDAPCASIRIPSGAAVPAPAITPLIHRTRWVPPRNTTPSILAVGAPCPSLDPGRGVAAAATGSGAFPKSGSSRSRSSSIRCSGLEKSRPRRSCACRPATGGRISSAHPIAPAGARALHARQRTARKDGNPVPVAPAGDRTDSDCFTPAPRSGREAVRSMRACAGATAFDVETESAGTRRKSADRLTPAPRSG